MSDSNIIRFYDGRGTTDGGVSLDHIVHIATDQWLEQTHDYIQMVFPVPERSRFVPDSPLLTTEDIATFRVSVHLRVKVFSALSRMLRFYAGNPDYWISPRNHNYLRITRIIRFLVLIGEQGLAEFFENAMVNLGDGQVDEETRWFWTEALKKEPAWLTLT